MLPIEQRRLARAARKAALPQEAARGAPADPEAALAFYETRKGSDPFALGGIGRVDPLAVAFKP